MRHGVRQHITSDSRGTDIGFTIKGLNQSIKQGNELRSLFESIASDEIEVQTVDKKRNIMTSIGVVRGILGDWKPSLD